MKKRIFTSLKCLLISYLCISLVFPLLQLFLRIPMNEVGLLLSQGRFLPMLWDSLLTTLISTVISVSLSFLLALGLNRCNIPGKTVYCVLFTLPMLIPSISHGMGLVLLLGDNGILTNILGINIGLYGYKGIILGSVLYSFPVAFLLFQDGFQYEDYHLYEAAQVLGISPWHSFRGITLPAMKRSIVASFLAVFTMVFTDYGVPLMTGGTVMTLPVYMYREVIGMMNHKGGALVGGILLFPAFVAFLFDLRSSRDSAVSNVAKPYQISCRPVRDRLVMILFLLFSLTLLLPVGAFLCLSFLRQYPLDLHFTLSHVKKVFSSGIGLYLINSLAVASMTAFVGMCLSYFAAFITTRSKQSLSNKVLHLISLLSMAVPGVVLGLCYVLSFRSFRIYSTIFILAMVNIAHFFSSPYLLAYNSLRKFNPNLEDVGQSLGIGPMQLLFSVYIPSTAKTLIEMYSYYFVNAMITISAVSFLINFKTNTLSLMIPQLESQSFPEGTAIISLLILLINLGVKALAYLVGKYGKSAQ